MASKREHISAAWRFFHSGFRAWDQTAALFPSSRYLVHALTCQPELPRARAVVELGPGIGNVTRAILRRMHQDARLYAGLLSGDEQVTLPLAADRHAWVQVVRGVVHANGQRMAEGDGLAVSEVDTLTLSGGEDAELLVFDLP